MTPYTKQNIRTFTTTYKGGFRYEIFDKVNMKKQDNKDRRYAGGVQGNRRKALTSIMINKDVPADCDPLGPDNTLISQPASLRYQDFNSKHGFQ
jgi:hypothetical protein